MRGTTWLAEELLASQEGPCSMELVDLFKRTPQLLIIVDNQQDSTILVNLFISNQLQMFRVITSIINQHLRLYNFHIKTIENT